ncbi:hypothetical protein MAPG_02343 [Magnaporthiopsis poae ATCC 64411]|uniref:Altered inheritance of mitochondria protein 11 n=1 Tax=Magnaporthiopsis poae (strain ATCC 64411 / 73-15) TaxID=644358 RepID=A0A0C4DR42_MAGP6|nr:hypothetical protein MAPG_02343 [Magnaporthiopsis poae ATCC 64411]
MFSWFSSSKPPAKDPAPPAAATLPPPPPAGPSAETQLDRLRRQDQLRALQEKDRAANSALTPRSLKQLGLFFAGAGFLFWSTGHHTPRRRAQAARRRPEKPTAVARDGRPTMDPDADGGMMATQALGLATLNVFSFAIMMTGGLAWGFDISSIDDMRDRARKQILGEAARKTDEESEKELEEWMESMLLRLKNKKPAPADKPQDEQER